MSVAAHRSRKRLPSLQTVLFLVSLIFLLLPLGGIYFMRIYESALIRQTESELISQAAFVSAMYKAEIQNQLRARQLPMNTYGIAVDGKGFKDGLRPILPKLDLTRDRVYPARPQPQFTHDHADAIAEAAGEKIRPVLEEARKTTLSGVKVLDYQGLVTSGKEEHGLSFRHSEEFQQAQTGQPVSLIRDRKLTSPRAPLGSISRNTRINVYVALPVMEGNRLYGVIWVNRTPVDVMQTLYNKRFELIWTALGLLLATLIITALTSFAITRPILALMQKTRLIAQGKPEGLAPLENPVTRDIAELSASVDTMAQTIQHRSQYIQNFATHVSHEFKTPLTALQGSTELLLENADTMSPEQRQKFLHNISKDTQRLNHLVSRLLELARADLAEPLSSTCELGAIVQDVAARFLTQGLDVQSDGISGFSIEISADSMEGILSGLLENSRQAGATQVTLRHTLQGNMLTLYVQDNGPGISPGNREKIFTPFFTTRRDHGGTGLGLSITQSLLERQGGSIELQETAWGACFRLMLPLA